MSDRVHRGSALLALVGIGAALLFAQPAVAAGTLVPLTLIAPANMLHTSDFAAIEQGYFVRHGLSVKIVHTQTGAEANAAMASGSAQLLDTAMTTIASARAAGLPFVMFVPVLNDATTAHGDDSLAIVARADSGIKPDDARSFVGKKVGLSTGGTGDQYLTAWLVQAGVDRKRVTYLNVEPGDQLTTIQNGDVDAVATWEPYQTLILAKMGSRATLIKRGGPVLGYVLGLQSTEAYVRDHPDVIQGVTDAMVEAESWVRAHPAEAAAVATHWIPGLDLAVAQEAIKHLTFDPRVSGCTLGAFTESTRNLVAQGKLTHMIPTEQLITDRYVLQAQRTDPRSFADLKPIPASCSR